MTGGDSVMTGTGIGIGTGIEMIGSGRGQVAGIAIPHIDRIVVVKSRRGRGGSGGVGGRKEGIIEDDLDVLRDRSFNRCEIPQPDA